MVNLTISDPVSFIEKGIKTKTESSSVEFSQKVVVFLDMLGTTDEIGLDEIEKSKLMPIVQKVMNIREYLNQLIEERPESIKMIAISDCFILVADKRDISRIVTIVSKAIHFCLSQDEPILIRGGISYGDVCIEGGISQIMGPAYNNAYKLESEVSEYPRVIVSGSLYDDIGTEYLHISCDGIYSLDFIKVLKNEGLNLDAFIVDVKSKLHVKNGDRSKISTKEYRIAKKRNWLINYFGGI